MSPLIAHIAEALNGRLARATMGTFAMRVTATALGFLSVVLLARRLGTVDYGAYAYAMAWANLLTVPSLLGFDKLLIREVSISHARAQWARLRGIMKAANRISTGLGGAVITVTGVTVWFVRDRLDAGLLLPLWTALLLVPLMVLIQLRQAAMMGLQWPIRAQISETVLRPVLFILLLVGSFWMFPASLSAEDAVLMNAAAVVVAFVVGGVMLRVALRAETQVEAPVYDLKPWIGSALPLALLASLQVINQRVDLVMLGAMKGSASVGIYSVALQAASLISFFLVAVNTAVGPTIARIYSKRDMEGLQRLVTQSSRVILAVSAPVAVVLILWGGPLLGLLGEGFSEGAAALAILSVGHLIGAAMGSVGLILSMTGKETLAAKGAAVGVVANVLLNLLLIPRYGIVGAALATTTTVVLWNSLYAIWIYRQLGVMPSFIGGRI